MGRRRKTLLEEDLAVAVEDIPTKPSRQLVDAEHTIKYRKPIPDPAIDLIEEEPEDPEEIEEEVEEEDKPKRRSHNTSSFRAKLKQELGERGIGGEEQLRLRVDRLPYYDIDGRTGLTAEKEFVRNFICQKDFILSDEYLDETAKLYGPGAYWFTLRHKTSILKNWHMKIGGAPIAPAAAAIVQTGDAPSHAMGAAATPIYPPHFAPHVPAPAPRTLKQELKELVETKRLMKELSDDGAPSPPPADPDVTLMTYLARDPTVMDKLSKGVLGKLLGSAPAERDEWAGVALELIKSGQALQIISATINAFFNGFGNLIPKGGGNGQTQMAQTQVQNHQANQGAQVSPIQDQQEGTNGDQQNEAGRFRSTELPQGVQTAPEVSEQIAPEDELIYALIAAMERQASTEEARNIINVICFKAPWVRESIDELINRSTDEVLALLTAYHPPVAEMAHAREWLDALIAALTINSQEGDSE